MEIGFEVSFDKMYGVVNCEGCVESGCGSGVGCRDEVGCGVVRCGGNDVWRMCGVSV